MQHEQPSVDLIEYLGGRNVWIHNQVFKIPDKTV